MHESDAKQAASGAAGLLEVGVEVEVEVETKGHPTDTATASAQADAAFDRWSAERLEAVIAAPEVLTASRFARDPSWPGAGRGPSHLLLFELSEATPGAAERAAAKLRGESAETQATHASIAPASLYHQLGDVAARSADSPGSAILHVHVDVVSDQLDRFLRWYVGEHVPAVLEAPGMLSARRYENVERPAPAGQHRFCTVYSMQDASVISRPETLAASQRGACPADLEPHRTAFNQVYRRIGGEARSG